MSKLQNRQLPNPEILRAAGAPQAIIDWLRDLTSTLAFSLYDIRNLQNGGKQPILHLDELDNEPDQPFNGMLVYADGTNWNPGSGEGFYGYENGSWVKL